MAGRIREAGITQLHVEIVGMNEPERLNEAFQNSHKIYASAAVFAELKQLQPDKTQLFPMKLEQSSENLLHEVATQRNKSPEWGFIVFVYVLLEKRLTSFHGLVSLVGRFLILFGDFK